MSSAIQRLQQRSSLAFGAYCIVAAFGTYFCMYAFRKPFTAGTFEGSPVLGGLAPKTLFVLAQVLGYTVSKFLGIRVVSSMPAHRRALAILGLIVIAESALVLFACTPPPWSAVWLFVNGLPLGMVFGLVLAFLEGRRQTEALAAGLCASFILSSGVVKSTGRGLLSAGVEEVWMPAATGALFLLPLVVFVGMLAWVPPPAAADVEARSERQPMTRDDRRALFRRHAPLLIGLVATYVLLTIGRSVRDDFAVEIWQGLGVSDRPEIFARTETLVMFGVLLLNGAAICIRDNERAFLGALSLSAFGFGVLVLAVLMHWAQWLEPFWFMVLSGIGLYVPYVAFHTTVFERLMATFRERGNIGYLMYLADSFGYLGYVGVLVVRNLTVTGTDFVGSYCVLSLAVAIACWGAVLAIQQYSRRHLARGSDWSPTSVGS